MNEIEKAKKILNDAGYIVIKPTKRQLEDCKECSAMCEKDEEKECISCSCSCCLFQ